MKTNPLIAIALAATLAATPMLSNARPHSSGNFIAGIAAGIIGAGVISAVLSDPAPAPVAYTQPQVVYAQPAPVAYTQPQVVYAQPAPVVYAQPQVVYAQPAPVVYSTRTVYAAPRPRHYAPPPPRRPAPPIHRDGGRR
jgi:hypothetical protein